MPSQPLTIVESTPWDQFTPVSGVLKNGNIVFAWGDSDYFLDDLYQIKLKILSPDMTEIYRNFSIGELGNNIDYIKQIFPCDDGGFFLLWENSDESGGWQYSNAYMIQRFNAQGVAVSDAINLDPSQNLSTNNFYLFDQDGKTILANGLPRYENGKTNIKIIFQEIDINGNRIGDKYELSVHPKKENDFFGSINYYTSVDGDFFITINNIGYTGYVHNAFGSFKNLIEIDFSNKTSSTKILDYMDALAPFEMNTVHIEGLGFAVSMLTKNDVPSGGAHNFEVRVYGYDGAYIGRPVFIAPQDWGTTGVVIGNVGGSRFGVVLKDPGIFTDYYVNIYDYNFNQIESRIPLENFGTVSLQLTNELALVYSMFNVAQLGFQDFDIKTNLSDFRNEGEMKTINGNFIGTKFDDYIIGSDSSNSIYLMTGNDTVDGNQGDDSIFGHDGNDQISGGVGNDMLDGGAGADILAGGLGNDTYFVDSNLDSIYEIFGEGTDTVNSSAAFTQLDAELTLENLTYTGTASGTLYGNSLGNVLTGGNNSDNLNGFFGVDILYGGGGDDFLYIDEQDFLNGGAGYDAVYIQTTVGTMLDVGLSQVEFVVGYTGNDTLNGSTSTVSIALIGGGGADVLSGGVNNDVLDGGAGNDILSGGAGNDTFVIDSNLDSIFEVIGGGTDTVHSSAAFTQLDTGNTLENLTYTGTGNGTLYGNSLGNILTGGINSDNLNGFFGVDILYGGGGDDYLYIDEQDFLNGGAGYDAVYIQTTVGTTVNVGLSQVEFVVGYTGNDVLDGSTSTVSVALVGGGGADTITGGSTSDYLYGSAGADVFRITVGVQYDAILDFVDAGGADDDRINVSALGASFDTIAEILAATTDYSGTSVIDFGGGNQLYLYQIAKISLTADDFIF
ncbi:MAG: calcium-binding protein [Beijerinckiaceae bacterium]